MKLSYDEIYAFMLIEINSKIENTNGFIPFDLYELAQKYNSNIGTIREVFHMLHRNGVIDIFQEEDNKRKIGVISVFDSRRKELLKIAKKRRACEEDESRRSRTEATQGARR